MKKTFAIYPIVLALLALLLAPSCVKEENYLEHKDAKEVVDGEYVTLDGSLRLPFAQDKGSWIATRGAKMGEEAPTVKFLYLAVFNSGDILYEIRKAKPGTQSHPTAVDAGFNCGTEAENYLTYFHVDSLTTVSAGERYVHFIATTKAIESFENMEMNLMDEATFVRYLTTTDAGLAYWARRKFKSITNSTKMKGIKMIRNFAKVKVMLDPSVTNFEILGFKVMDTPVYGTIAPFNTNTNDYVTVNGELQINFDRYANYELADSLHRNEAYTWLTNTDLYTGFMPPVIQYNDWSAYYTTSGDTMDANDIWIDAGSSDYLYECSYRPDRNPFIIIKGRWRASGTVTSSDPVYYYKADFVYPGEHGNEYYNILRNFCYTLKITGVTGKGSETVYDAVNSIALNNFEGSTMAQELTNIALDDSRLYVSKTDVLITEGTSFTMYVKSATGADFSTDDNAHIYRRMLEPTSGEYIVSDTLNMAISATNETSGSYAGWRKVVVTIANPANLHPGEVWKQPIVFYNASGLTRTVNLTIRRPMTLTVDMQDVVEGTENTECELKFSIPSGFTEFRFPMYFYIEQESNTLYPKALADGAVESLSVVTGPSKIPGRTGNTYCYRRILSWQEYSSAPSDVNGIKTFSCYFKSLVEASATTVWVVPDEENNYFYPYDDIENDYTNKDSFLNEKIAGKVSFPYYGVQVAVDGSVTVPATANSDGEITYTSSNPSVATVDASGKVTGRAAGTAVITASVAATGSYTAASASYTVNVTSGALCNLQMAWNHEPTYVLKTVAAGNTAGIHAPIVETSVAAGYTVSIAYSTSSTDGGAVTVDETNAETNGYVTIKGTSAGTVKITATATVRDGSSNVVMTRELSYDLNVVSSHPVSGTVYHNETFLGSTMGDYSDDPAKGGIRIVTDGATYNEGNDVTELFHTYTFVYATDNIRYVWAPYYNPSNDFNEYGVFASGNGSIVPPTQEESGGSLVTNYHRANYASHSRLVSKEIDLSASAGATITFYHASNYMDAALMATYCKAYISKDGGANWVPATINYYPSGRYVYIRTSIDIPADYLTANFRLAFDYTSTSSLAGTWEIRNLLITEN
jgi:hypothetical protein